MRSRLLFPIFFLSCIILSLHVFALKFFFYWTYGWFDILVHTLGGVLIAFIAIYLLEKFQSSNLNIILVCGFFVPLLISTGWEVFEYVSGITFFSSQYTLDTTLDISIGVVGGIAGSALLVYFSHDLSSQDSHV